MTTQTKPRPISMTTHPHTGSLRPTQLAFIGVGGIIGAGFFLGSGVPIRAAGPAVLLAFLLGAIVTAQVTGALASIAVSHPVEGSFKVFADMYLGRFIGFMQGWVYYLTGILTISSEAVAMAVFTKTWFPAVHPWLLTAIYTALIILINAFGVRGFNRIESIMSAAKIGATVGFILYIGIWILSGLFAGHAVHTGTLTGAPPSGHRGGFFPTGAMGLFRSMLIVIFAYAGIGVFATAVPELKHPKQVDKAAWMTVGSLFVLYIFSIFCLLLIRPWWQVSTSQSPFVLALSGIGPDFIAQAFNAIIFIASFSVMAGTVFSVNEILENLSHSGEAPGFAGRMWHGRVNFGALGITTACLAIAITASYLLPSNVYQFLISASSFLTFLNWFLILLTFLVWRRKTTEDSQFVSSLAFGQPVLTICTMIFLLVLTVVALIDPTQRIGFYAFIGLTLCICIVYPFVRGTGHVSGARSNEGGLR